MRKTKTILSITGVASVILMLLLATLTPFFASWVSPVLVFGMFLGGVGFIELLKEETK